eukprot:maker-scaffold_38-snap-gene-2.28-mRNA-1 protein AED:0.08 eAED:0.86 QI:75/0/0.5/1/0/0/2/0/202
MSRFHNRNIKEMSSSEYKPQTNLSNLINCILGVAAISFNIRIVLSSNDIEDEIDNFQDGNNIAQTLAAQVIKDEKAFSVLFLAMTSTFLVMSCCLRYFQLGLIHLNFIRVGVLSIRLTQMQDAFDVMKEQGNFGFLEEKETSSNLTRMRWLLAIAVIHGAFGVFMDRYQPQNPEATEVLKQETVNTEIKNTESEDKDTEESV